MAKRDVLREVTVTLALAPEMELAARQCACEWAESIAMSHDKVEEVGMAVVEACINAIEHSKAADRQLDLTLSVLGEDEPETLRITIRDKGVGFNPEEVVDPNIEDKLRSKVKRGWGLKIIEGLMDEVNVESGEHGTAVIMSKSR